jgi:hypothetical protein
MSNATQHPSCVLNAFQTIKEAHGQTGWLETCARTVGHDSGRGKWDVVQATSLLTQYQAMDH